jgi:hypothetical protein
MYVDCDPKNMTSIHTDTFSSAVAVKNEQSSFFGHSAEDHVITISKSFTSPMKYVQRDTKLVNFLMI